MNRSLLVLVGLGATVTLLPGAKCDKSRDCPVVLPSWVQVERLGRPAVNEGLVITNDYLNAYNSIPPSADLSPAAAPVLGEAAVVLGALGNSPARTNDIVAAFIPDVMRIDTGGASGYATAALPVGALGVVRPVRGRMITDDVIDITLSVLSNGAVLTDNVSYAGVGGNAAQPGHTAPSTAFPYLPAPN